MDNNEYTIEHRKGQHLLAEKRHDIEVHLRENWSIYKIANHLHRPYNTIKNEVKRGTVLLYHDKVSRYKAIVGEEQYRANRKNCTRKYQALEKKSFLEYVVRQFIEKGWSFDVSFGRALKDKLFDRKQMVCTKTLYNYVDLQLIDLKNIDLPERIQRKRKKKHIRENKKKLSDSIDLRPETIETRETYGHWEIDSVLGKKGRDEPCIMSLIERKTRFAIFLKLANHMADAMMDTIDQVRAYFGEKFSQVFQSITADNGSEFSRLTELEEAGVKIYYTHPYSSWERGTNENHNRLLRRFIPKGKSISDYSVDDLLFFADRLNTLPRKVLGYHVPDELFDREMDLIYALTQGPQS